MGQRAIRVVLFSWWVCLLPFVYPGLALGQVPGIQIETVVLQNAAPTSFTANSDLRMDVELGDVRPSQARVFRGTKSLLPRTGRPTPDGCLEYDTQVYETTYSGNLLYVAPTDRSWLLSPDLRSYVSERFVLVFESGAPRDLRIKIATRDVESYFGRGIEIEVVPDEYLPERVADEVRAARSQYAALLRRVGTDDRGCLELVAASDAVLFMKMASCTEPLAPPAPGMPEWVASITVLSPSVALELRDDESGPGLLP